ncbi:MAG: hypothetical protein JSW50_16120 [Candidatus Latescibacterota bacterium]|nr:MAG: hypothetical protein JSW50_16120 [Candidatus Latescibacterota bacterium]
MPMVYAFPLKRFALAAIAVMVVLAGCGDYDAPKGTDEIVGTAKEAVSAPDRPAGKVIVEVDENVEFTASGAKSSRGHALEYRFDFDAEGDRDFSPWSSSHKASVAFSKQGSPVIKAQARCAEHRQEVSGWSEGLVMMVGQGPETEITKVEGSYFAGATLKRFEIDFQDGVPDTVPYGTWITVRYKGIDTTIASAECTDPINKCMRYQKRFARQSDRVDGWYSQTPWLPEDPEDNNLIGVTDSTSMNIGSVEYTIQVSASDSHDRRDGTPAELSIVGNFDPTLDSHSIKNHTGEEIGDGGTIVWNWWEPVDSGLTVENSQLMKTKTFYFVIEATGHDDPRERPGSGVYSWFYEFIDVGSSSTSQFARSDRWVDAATVNALSDTFTWVAIYPEADVNGDDVFVNNPPSWNGQSYDFSVVGRDLPSNESFTQRMFVDGENQLIKQYPTGELGRWTVRGELRFRIELRR